MYNITKKYKDLCGNHINNTDINFKHLIASNNKLPEKRDNEMKMQTNNHEINNKISANIKMNDKIDTNFKEDFLKFEIKSNERSEDNYGFKTYDYRNQFNNFSNYIINN